MVVPPGERLWLSSGEQNTCLTLPRACVPLPAPPPSHTDTDTHRLPHTLSDTDSHTEIQTHTNINRCSDMHTQIQQI